MIGIIGGGLLGGSLGAIVGGAAGSLVIGIGSVPYAFWGAFVGGSYLANKFGEFGRRLDNHIAANWDK